MVWDAFFPKDPFVYPKTPGRFPRIQAYDPGDLPGDDIGDHQLREFKYPTPKKGDQTEYLEDHPI